MNQPMNINAAIALLTGPGSLTDPKLGCLGDADLAAVLVLLDAVKAKAKAKPGRRAGKLYRVASVCEAVHEVYAKDEADAYDRMMCGDGTLIESDTHDTAITLVRASK